MQVGHFTLKKHCFSVSMQMTRLFHLSSFDLLVFPQSVPEPKAPAVLPPSLQDIEELSEAVAELSTVEEVMKYLEPERWQMDMEELYKPTWHVLGKSFIHSKKARGRTLLTCLFYELNVNLVQEPVLKWLILKEYVLLKCCVEIIISDAFEVELISIFWGKKFNSTAAHHVISRYPCVKSWKGQMSFSGPAASWWSAVVETVPAALTGAMTVSVFLPESQRNIMR